MDNGQNTMGEALASGDKAALLAIVYDDLRRMAQAHMSRERGSHTLQATALVHEAYMRLADTPSWHDRNHFYAAVHEAMRQILIDHARRVGSEKRGGGMTRVTLGPADACVELPLEQAAALYEAIDQLERQDPRAAAVTRLRFLGGFSVEETARTLSISVRSVHREWRFARAWLFDRLGK